jgi:hypothetical protein
VITWELDRRSCRKTVRTVLPYKESVSRINGDFPEGPYVSAESVVIETLKHFVHGTETDRMWIYPGHPAWTPRPKVEHKPTPSNNLLFDVLLKEWREEHGFKD